jgi:hypothetical protein
MSSSINHHLFLHSVSKHPSLKWSMDSNVIRKYFPSAIIYYPNQKALSFFPLENSIEFVRANLKIIACENKNYYYYSSTQIGKLDFFSTPPIQFGWKVRTHDSMTVRRKSQSFPRQWASLLSHSLLTVW